MPSRRRFGIMDTEGVAGQQAVDESTPDERSERRASSSMDHHRTRHDNDAFLFGTGVLDEGRGLANGCLHPSLG